MFLDNSDSIALLWNTPSWSEDNRMMLEELYRKLSGEDTAGWILAVSSCYPTVNSISRSYMEALTIGEVMQLKGKSGIVYYRDYQKTHGNHELYVIEAEMKLRQGLMADHGAATAAALEELETALIQNWGFENSNSRKFVLFHIIQSVVPIAEKASIPYINERIEEWIHYKNLGDFLSSMREICMDILESRQREKDEQVNELYREIVAYIEERYDDSNISLGELADRFGLSVSYLSRFFRKYSGKTFLEYVTDKRMERVCHLLKHTDLKIKDIVEQVGYMDVASFTKKFRNLMGVSPAKYREQVQREEGEKG